MDSSESLHIPSCFTQSSERTHSNPNEVRDIACSSQEVDLASRPPCHSGYEWVDPGVTYISTHFHGSSTIDGFIHRVSILKPDSPSNVIATNSCSHTERVYHGRENGSQDFFYVYICLFTNLDVTFPFNEFTMGVLRFLDVVPTQFHPNSWAALQAFRLICDVFRLMSSPQSFLFYFNSRSAQLVG